MKINTSEITWYEDGSIMEWWNNDSLKVSDRRVEHVTLVEATKIALENKIVLYIQPTIQEEVLIMDFSEEE